MTNFYTSKAAQKRDLDKISRDFYKLYDVIMGGLLDLRESGKITPDECDALYWNVPCYPHEWKERHTNAHAPLFPNEVARMNELVAERLEVKAIPIIPPTKSKEQEAIKAAEAQMQSIINSEQDDYKAKLAIARLFGGANVSVDWHFVTNEHNTTFTRFMFFLNGQRTSLAVCMAVAQKLKDEREAGA